MLSSFSTALYIFIAVQYLTAEAGALTNIDFEAPLENPQVQSKLRNLRQCLSSKNVGSSMDNNYSVLGKDQRNKPDPNLDYLNHLLSRYLKGGKELDKRDVSKSEGKSKRAEKSRKVSDNTKTKISGDQKFDDWTVWSACSVTCGKGRHIRWRHCRQNCEGVETEMEEKECQLPACPNKLFGLIKL